MAGEHQAWELLVFLFSGEAACTLFGGEMTFKCKREGGGKACSNSVFKSIGNKTITPYTNLQSSVVVPMPMVSAVIGSHQQPEEMMLCICFYFHGTKADILQFDLYCRRHRLLNLHTVLHPEISGWLTV